MTMVMADGDGHGRWRWQMADGRWPMAMADGGRPMVMADGGRRFFAFRLAGFGPALASADWGQSRQLAALAPPGRPLRGLAGFGLLGLLGLQPGGSRRLARLLARLARFRLPPALAIMGFGLRPQASMSRIAASPAFGIRPARRMNSREAPAGFEPGARSPEPGARSPEPGARSPQKFFFIPVK